MSEREISVQSVRDLYTIQNQILSSRSADAYRAVDLARQVAATVWLSRGIFITGSQRSKVFLQRLRFLCSQVPPLVDIVSYGIDDDGVGFVALPVLDGAIAVAPIREASEIERRFLRMLRIVDRMHSSGLICGDLCPASFWFNRSGEVSFVSAFGPDAGEQGDALATIPEEVAAFNAPEIYKGEAPSLGSDVYSLGAIAWLMIFGDTSFLGNYASDGRISFPLISQGGAVPVWAHDVLSCALSEHSAERYSDVGAMIRALSTAKDRAASGENLPTKKSQSLLPMPSQQRLLVRNKPSPKEPIEEPLPPAPSFKLTLKMVVGIIALITGIVSLPIIFLLEESDPSAATKDNHATVLHDKINTDRPLKETLQDIDRDAGLVADDHEKLKSLIVSRDPIAHDSLVQLAIGAKSIESRRKVEEAIIDRARRMGSIRAAEEVRIWLQSLSAGVPPSYDAVLKAVDPTLPKDAVERYIRLTYSTLPALSMRLTAALGFDAKDINVYQQLLAQLVGDSLKLDDANAHSAAALVLADPITAETYADDVIQEIAKIPDTDIQWLLDLLALRRDPNIKVIAHSAIDRNLLGPGKKIFAKILRDRDDISAQLSVSMVNAVAGTLTVADIAEIGSWYDMQCEAALLGILATNTDKEILREAFDTVASKAKKGEIPSLMIDRIRNHYWETRDSYAHLVGIVAFSDEFTDAQLDEALDQNQKLIAADNKLLDILLRTNEPKFLQALIKEFPNSLGAGRLINLLSFNDQTVKLLAINQLKDYNQIQLLQLILEAFNREKDETVKQAYRDSFWFIKEREAKRK
jgi:serine/threonine protein kinase